MGLPGGIDLIAAARTEMLEIPNGIRGACETLASNNVRVTFVAPSDPRFSPISRP